MARHRQQQQGESSTSTDDEGYFDSLDHRLASSHQRRSSDATHDRSRRKRRGSDSDSDSSSDIESLPDRFDSHGQPLGRNGSSSQGLWTSRSGEFERRPQRDGDFNVRGAWHVGGTDGESVDRIAKSVTGALDGKGSWMGVIGEVLGGAAAGNGGPSGSGQGKIDDRDKDRDDERRRRR